jgi:hypothetical protein
VLLDLAADAVHDRAHAGQRVAKRVQRLELLDARHHHFADITQALVETCIVVPPRGDRRLRDPALVARPVVLVRHRDPVVVTGCVAESDEVVMARTVIACCELANQSA